MSSMELGVVLDLGCSSWLENFDFGCILYRECDIAQQNSFLSLVFIASEIRLDTLYGDKWIRPIGVNFLGVRYKIKLIKIITINHIKSVSLTDEQLCIWCIGCSGYAGSRIDHYASMIGSLMYLTSSRLDIMFVVCACARFQVTPKVSHLHVVKRIFRYLKGQPKLGLWYPKDSPFDLEAYTDSDYAGASLDRKSTTGGCQFLRSRLISWQCKKQTIVANSTTEAEYVAAASCSPEELGKGSEIPTDPQHTPTIIQPSISQSQKKQPRRKQRKDTEVPQPSGSIEPITDETANEEHVPTHSNDPLLSGLGAQEDASKQGRRITNLDADAETLIEIKAAKPKAVTTTATTTTTVVTRPKARGVVVQEPSEFTKTTSPSQLLQAPQAKDKGKEKIEPEKPLKKKDQILIDEEIAQKLQAQLNAELKEEEKLAK
ncbi:hypothetical protein Tco_0018567 [Tanacetum coccineum]